MRLTRTQALALLDNPGAVADRLSVEQENRHGAAIAELFRDRGVTARYRGAPHVRDPLVVERPARLLVEVRHLEVPQRWHAASAHLTPIVTLQSRAWHGRRPPASAAAAGLRRRPSARFSTRGSGFSSAAHCTS